MHSERDFRFRHFQEKQRTEMVAHGFEMWMLLQMFNIALAADKWLIDTQHVMPRCHRLSIRSQPGTLAPPFTNIRF
jgi:hypothetical protein